MRYTEINANTIDSWNKEGWEWGTPISHEAYQEALKGNWQVVLTPTKPVPACWFPDLKGLNLLGLACGGGQQMPVFQAAGANCTVLDYADSQLDRERQVAEREGYEIVAVRADMTERLPFEDETFDVIFHPVSNCYVEDVQHIWRECSRILKKGGVLLAGMDNGINYIWDDNETTLAHALPYNPLKDPALMEESMKNNDGVQFSHTLEEQIRAGFVIRDLYEDTNGYGKLHEMGISTFWATLAEKN